MKKDIRLSRDCMQLGQEDSLEKVWGIAFRSLGLCLKHRMI